MALTEKDYYIIDKYLTSNLNSEEQDYFESQATNTEFKNELSYKIDLQQATTSVGRSRKKEVLQKLEQDIQAQNSEVVNSNIKWILLAAAILILAILYLLFNASKANSSDQIFAQYFKPYPNVVSVIKRDDPDTDVKADPFIDYEQGNYDKAIKGFQQLDSLKMEAAFYQAIALLAQQSYEEAESMLIQISKDKSNRFQKAAEWYLALTSLKLKKNQAFEVILKKIIIEADHPFHENAKSLDMELK